MVQLHILVVSQPTCICGFDLWFFVSFLRGFIWSWNMLRVVSSLTTSSSISVSPWGPQNKFSLKMFLFERTNTFSQTLFQTKRTEKCGLYTFCSFCYYVVVRKKGQRVRSWTPVASSTRSLREPRPKDDNGFNGPRFGSLGPKIAALRSRRFINLMWYIELESQGERMLNWRIQTDVLGDEDLKPENLLLDESGSELPGQNGKQSEMKKTSKHIIFFKTKVIQTDSNRSFEWKVSPSSEAQVHQDRRLWFEQCEGLAETGRNEEDKEAKRNGSNRKIGFLKFPCEKQKGFWCWNTCKMIDMFVLCLRSDFPSFPKNKNLRIQKRSKTSKNPSLFFPSTLQRFEPNQLLKTACGSPCPIPRDLGWAVQMKEIYTNLFLSNNFFSLPRGSTCFNS